MRSLATLANVSPASLSMWFSHRTWPSAYLLARLGERVGLVLAWRSDHEPWPELALGGWHQAALPGLAIEPVDAGYRHWFPGAAAPRDQCEATVMRLGAEIAWRRVHRARLMVGAMAKMAAMEPKTWRAVEMGITNTGAARPSAPGIDKFLLAAVWLTCVIKQDLPPPPERRLIVWRSADGGLPRPQWTPRARDNLDETELTPRPRPPRQPRGRG